MNKAIDPLASVSYLEASPLAGSDPSYFWAVLTVEHRASCMLGKYYVGSHPPTHVLILLFCDSLTKLPRLAWDSL